MKKFISIITALSIAMASILSAVTVSAAEKITADEVREMIYSTGLKIRADVWEKIIIEQGIEQDVLKPETRKVKDVIDVDTSYREFDMIQTENGGYITDNIPQAAVTFYGYNSNNVRVVVRLCPEDYPIDVMAGKIGYQTEHEKNIGLTEDYDRIAEIINNSEISDVKEIKIINYPSVFRLTCKCVYVSNKRGKEYAICTFDYTDDYAKPLGREVRSIKNEAVIPFDEWCETVVGFEKNCSDSDAEAEFEEIQGDEIRDTDTRAAYIGTESKFADVSGDLVSYVNELNDLGIINGYDENMFMPDNTITRAEAAAMLARMLKYTGNYNGEFSDVRANDWFANDVAALTSAGVINGYDENTFVPHNDIKYQEVMKILVFTLGYVTKYDTVFDNFYPQQTNQKAMQIGLTDGLGSFDTASAITRGDMAIMLSNALDTHMFTAVKMIPKDGIGGGMSQKDITLIDYLNGKKLNGTIPKAYFED